MSFTVKDDGTTVLDSSKLAVSGGLKDAHIGSTAGIKASKQQHQHTAHYAQLPGTAVLAETKDLFMVQGATGTFDELQAAVTGAIATDVSRTVTIDVHKSSGGGAFATMMTTPLVLNTSSVLRVVQAGVLDSTKTALVVGDIVRLIVTVAGGGGVQAQGLIVSTRFTEDYVS